MLLSYTATADLWRVVVHHLATAVLMGSSETENDGDETHNGESKQNLPFDTQENGFEDDDYSEYSPDCIKPDLFD